MSDLNPVARLMLGTVTWERDDWVGSYYPEDLPRDWRLAYYANDAGCVCLPPALWLAPDAALLAAVDEAPADLVLFLEVPPGGDPRLPDALSALDGRRVVLLATVPLAAPRGVPQWLARGGDRWVDDASGACLVRWSLASADLRRLRVQAESLPPRLAALVLDGPAASPALLPDVRRLLELLGRG